MTQETLQQAALPPESQSVEAQPFNIEALEQNRQAFVGELTGKGLISKEFAESGVLDSFMIDPMTGNDSLKHILVGDEFGGLHHLATVMQLEIPGRSVGSVIYDPSKPSKKLSEYRGNQKVKPSGVYKSQDVRITAESGQEIEKIGSSSMFPNEWSTEDVLRAIVETTKVPGEYSPEKELTEHTAEFNGVKIRAHTTNDGKIRSAIPG
jgi:hypothetical protein